MLPSDVRRRAFLCTVADKTALTIGGGRMKLSSDTVAFTAMNAFVPSRTDCISVRRALLARMPLADFLARWRLLTGELPAAMLDNRSEMLALLVESVPPAPPSHTQTTNPANGRHHQLRSYILTSGSHQRATEPIPIHRWIADRVARGLAVPKPGSADAILASPDTDGVRGATLTTIPVLMSFEDRTPVSPTKRRGEVA